MKLRLLAVCLCLGCIEPPPEQSQTNTNNSQTNNTTVVTNNFTGNNSQPKFIGDPCENNTECASNFCFTPGSFGMPGGYCYAPCDASRGCPNGSHCALQDPRGNGVCVQSCEESCERPQFGCFDFDQDLKEECWPSGEGSATTGAACNTTTDCAGGNGAMCLDESVGYEGGYCSTRCNDPSDCGGNICLEGFCLADSCGGREGYEQVDIGEQSVCFPSATGEGKVGDGCVSRKDCGGGFNGFCLRVSINLAFCSLNCTDDEEICGVDHCGGIPGDPEGRKLCVKRCESSDDCIEGLECVGADEEKLCLPRN